MLCGVDGVGGVGDEKSLDAVKISLDRCGRRQLLPCAMHFLPELTPDLRDFFLKFASAFSVTYTALSLLAFIANYFFDRRDR